MYGVVEGPGTLTEAMTNTTMAKCVEQCRLLSMCGSFEWIPAEKSCKLNKERTPTVKPIMGYMFCSKTDDGMAIFDYFVFVFIKLHNKT